MENSCKLRIPIREGRTEGTGKRLFDVVETNRYEYGIEIKCGHEIYRISFEEIRNQMSLYLTETDGA